MLYSKHVSTPMDCSYQELSNQKSTPAEKVPYQQVIGSLMYLMIGSRPYLVFVIGELPQHAEAPTNFHWITLKCTIRYFASCFQTHSFLRPLIYILLNSICSRRSVEYLIITYRLDFRTKLTSTHAY